ncbi:uncharacterized protein LOC111294187 isoform X1 [Durio zibethinus]|uniref:Uncharacterized protein LOC111294187 isoform X1 n=1 Tax=Durio zibethinus TaxID=66656 RepID=A0A6P5YRJ8_DURZI|nr:uncharacterized protein LOC111294187 isoform X1 [Durio zibethinus]
MRIGKGNEKKGRMVSSPSMICARVWLGTVPFSQIREILFTFSGVLDPEELFEALNIHDGDNGLKEASALPSDSLAASRIERLDTTSMKIKPLPAPRRPKISAHRVGKTAKEAINPPQAQEKCGELTPNGGLKFHSGVQNTSKSRSGANHLNGAPNRSRCCKLQQPRTSTRTVSIKEKKPSSLQTGTQSSRGIKLNCAAQLEGEKTCQEFTSSGTIGNSPATTL